MKYELSPSILSADFSKLGEQVKESEQAGSRWLHIDVMDGLFVPSISFGMPVIRSLRGVSGQFFDVHLMIQDPGRYVEEFARCGANMITVHAEACVHLDRVLSQIHEAGCKAGVALNPATPLSAVEYVLSKTDMVLIMTVNPGFGGQKYIPEMTEKVRSMRSLANQWKPDLDIEVDGGISTRNVWDVLDAGANVVVAGSAVFGKGSITENVRAFQKEFQEFAS